jgi:hypothetical protein
MMRTLREYITEAQDWMHNPESGDDFAINIQEDYLIETYVVGRDQDVILIEGDDHILAVLDQYGMLVENQVLDESVMSSIDMDLRHIAKTQRMDALVDALRGDFGIKTQQYLQDMMDDVEQSLDQRGMRLADIKTKLGMLMDRIQEIYAGQELDEAEYQGRKVQLNKPMAGDVAKFKVYVRDPSTGNVKKVNFGDKTMRIKKSNPARRKSFRARHRCENPGPKTKARYWSCRKW